MSKGLQDKNTRPEAPPADPGVKPSSGVSRRSFLQGMGLTAGAASLPLGIASQARAAEMGKALGPGSLTISLKINGQAREVSIEPRMTLAETLREQAQLTGTKVVCDRGACGACTVMLDGQSVCSCMMLAVDARGKEITTIEGLAKGDQLDPVQQGFIDHDAMQCGFCTPGFIVRCRAFLNENPKPNLEEIKEGLAGNICRCGTYTHIFAAVQQAAEKGA